MADENVSFTMDLGSEGAAKLQVAVKEKLPHFMGYSDDVLAEYVVVLVCHGKQKEQAKKDLDAFLGEHSSAFVDWLWEHVASNIRVYLPSSQPLQTVEENEPSRVGADVSGKKSSETQAIAGNAVPVSTSAYTEAGEKPKKSREARRREWNSSDDKLSREDKDIARKDKHGKKEESSTNENSELKHKSSLKRRHSPEKWSRKERARHDDDKRTKRLNSSVVHAPRRLLQSAVREAVAPLTASTSKRSEPALKRLRSVVSTTLDNPESSLNTVEPLEVPHETVKSLPGMAVAMKAAAQAAEEASKAKQGGSVFDRLGKRIPDNSGSMNGMLVDHSPQEAGNYETRPNEVLQQQLKYRTFDTSSMINRGQKRGYSSLMDTQSIIPSNVETHQRGYDELQDQGPEKPVEESVTVQYRKQNVALAANTGNRSKIVNISVNVNTWKAPHYNPAKNSGDTETKQLLSAEKKPLLNHVGSQLGGSNVGPCNPNIATDTNITSKLASSREIKKDNISTAGANISGLSLEDSDSRTVFVSNVHFAATKEALIKHFSRCGPIVNVVMLCDAATGQPKGSAYIECATKETAEAALMLNEISFMSRMLKVVRKNAANIEPSTVAVRSAPLRRPPAFGAWRPSRTIFSRGPTAYRRSVLARPFGARSLQWRRDSSAGTQEPSVQTSDNSAANGNPVSSGNAQLSLQPRPHTYIRNASNQGSDDAGKGS